MILVTCPHCDQSRQVEVASALLVACRHCANMRTNRRNRLGQRFDVVRRVACIVHVLQHLNVEQTTSSTNKQLDIIESELERIVDEAMARRLEANV